MKHFGDPFILETPLTVFAYNSKATMRFTLPKLTFPPWGEVVNSKRVENVWFFEGELREENKYLSQRFSHVAMTTIATPSKTNEKTTFFTHRHNDVVTSVASSKNNGKLTFF